MGDSSVWIGAFHIQDAHHAASRRWLNQRVVSSTQLVIPTLVLTEVAGAIRRRTGSAESGRQAAEDVVSIPGLRTVELDLLLAWDAARIAANLALRGADAVYVAVARRLHLPLVTWDQEIQTRCP